MALKDQLSLVKFVFTTPDDSGYEEFAIVKNEDLALLQAGLAKTDSGVVAVSPRVADIEIGYKVVNHLGGINFTVNQENNQEDREGRIMGVRSGVCLNHIRNWYVVWTNVLVDHNGNISKL